MLPDNIDFFQNLRILAYYYVACSLTAQLPKKSKLRLLASRVPCIIPKHLVLKEV